MISIRLVSRLLIAFFNFLCTPVQKSREPSGSPYRSPVALFAIMSPFARVIFVVKYCSIRGRMALPIAITVQYFFVQLLYVCGTM